LSNIRVVASSEGSYSLRWYNVTKNIVHAFITKSNELPEITNMPIMGDMANVSAPDTFELHCKVSTNNQVVYFGKVSVQYNL
jgi:hypothetical protein